MFYRVFHKEVVRFEIRPFWGLLTYGIYNSKENWVHLLISCRVLHLLLGFNFKNIFNLWKQSSFSMWWIQSVQLLYERPCREDVNLTRKSFIEYWLDAFGTLSNINFIYIKNVDIMIELVIKTNSSCFFLTWRKNSKPNINYLWSLTAEKSFKK